MIALLLGWVIESLEDIGTNFMMLQKLFQIELKEAESSTEENLDS